MPEIKNRKTEKSIDNQRPFLGLRSFEEKNKSQFGGRDNEIKELYGLEENSVLTVIFGKSGIGKTSLIKAGLIPELRQNFYFPIYVRIDYSSSRTPLEQVRKIVFDEMQKKDAGVPEIGDTTLWEYFHNVNLLDDLVTPVLILDQFEEIFTLGEGKENVLELLIQLADLAENRIPLTVQGEYQKLNKTVPTHYAEQPYRVILSLREDYLARLEELKKYMPSIMHSRFRVVQMTIGQALEAAVKPGKGLIDERVALEIVKKLPGISLKDFDPLDQNGSGNKNLKVEPFLLSLVCDRLNEKRLEKGQKKITVDLVSNFNVTDVIYSFYTETVTPYGENVEQAIEDCLLTEGGFRKLQALEEFQRQYDISDETVDQLVDARILRKEIRDGVDYVELIHDVLAPIIKGKRSKRARIAREEKRQITIITARKKQRKRLIRFMSFIGLAIGLVLATTGYFAIENKNDKLALIEQNEKTAIAKNLLITSKIVGSVDKDTKKAMILARLGYLIEKKKDTSLNESIYSSDFYIAMYEALRSNGFNFFAYSIDNTVVQSIVQANRNEIYVGLNDSTLRIVYEESETDSILYKFSDGMVTSMDTYKKNDKNLLAITGSFDSILIHDLKLGAIIKRIPIPGSSQGEKSVTFTSNGGLVLSQDSSILRWEATFQEAAIIDSLKVNERSAIQFDPRSSTLIVGNSRGEVLTILIDDNSHAINKRQPVHTAVVTDITVSHKRKLAASSSRDNTIVIWDQQTWKPFQIKTGVLNPFDNSINTVSFTFNDDYVLAGYNDGTILRWPVSTEILERLICKETDSNLSEEEWMDYTENLELQQTEYDCEND